MFSKTIEKINTIEDNRILAIDDTIVEKTAKNVYGIQFVTSIFSGKH